MWQRLFADWLMGSGVSSVDVEMVGFVADPAIFRSVVDIVAVGTLELGLVVVGSTGVISAGLHNWIGSSCSWVVVQVWVLG